MGRNDDDFAEIFFFLGFEEPLVEGPGFGDCNLALGGLWVRSADFLLTVFSLERLFRLAGCRSAKDTDLAFERTEEARELSESYSSTLKIVDNYRKLAANLR